MSEVIRDIKGYPTSRDYAKLWELAQKQSVVCVVDFGKDCRDVAQTITNACYTHVSARGICYTDGDTVEKFTAGCARVNLEWLVPDEDLKADEDIRTENEAIRAAVWAYYHALDTRQNGDVAGYQLIRDVEKALGKSWIPGATLSKPS
jgi:hypothetical protein